MAGLLSGIHSAQAKGPDAGELRRHHVVSNITGITGMSISGERDPKVLASHREGPLATSCVANHRNSPALADLVLIPAQLSSFDGWASGEMLSLIDEAHTFRP